MFEKPSSYLEGIKRALFGELKAGINLEHLLQEFSFLSNNDV